MELRPLLDKGVELFQAFDLGRRYNLSRVFVGIAGRGEEQSPEKDGPECTG